MPFQKPLHALPRRPIVRTAEHRVDWTRGLSDGRDSATAIDEMQLEILTDDIGDIEELVERGRPKQALDLAARTLQMSPEELFGLLPAQTGAALIAYLHGLISGSSRANASTNERRRGYGRR